MMTPLACTIVLAYNIANIMLPVQHRKDAVMPTKSAKPKRKDAKPAKLSRTKRPEGMPLEDWQIGLRREHGRNQNFDIKNVGDDAVFSEFLVRNPDNQSSYTVIVRG